MNLARLLLAALVVPFCALATEHETAGRPDPLADFKKHVQHVQDTKRWAKSDVVWSDIAYDVRKTDSLVSPFYATFSGIRNSSEDGHQYLATKMSFEAMLAYQDSVWVLKKLTVGTYVARLEPIVKEVTPAEDDPGRGMWGLLETEMDLKVRQAKF